MLVDGFLDLARSLHANAEAEQRTAAEAEAAQAAAKAALEKKQAAAILDQSAPDIVPPVALVQEMPPMPPGCEEGILKGAYKLREVPAKVKSKAKLPAVQLLGSGAILREVIRAAELLGIDVSTIHRRERDRSPSK